MEITELISTYGYMGVAIALFFDILGVPFPAQMALTLSGIAWANGAFQPIPLILTAIISNVIGSTFAYFIGRVVGHRLIVKYGKYIGLTQEKFHHVEEKFEKYQFSIIFFGKFLPFISVWLLYVAGINKIDFWRFSFINGLAAICWANIYIFLGRYMGLAFIEFQKQLMHFLKYYATPVVVLGMILFFIIRYYRKQKQKERTVE